MKLYLISFFLRLKQFLLEEIFIGIDYYQYFSLTIFIYLLYRDSLLLRNSIINSAPILSQRDLLAALKSLVCVQSTEIRIAIVEGLISLLQERGPDIVVEGWYVILEILSYAPASMTSPAFLSDISFISKHQSIEEDACDGKNETKYFSGESNKLLESSEDSKANLSEKIISINITPDQWPREMLLTSFNCMKLIADDFLDCFLGEKELIKAIIECLSIFTAQSKDVNISLTSVELLWKVADFAITNISHDNNDLIKNTRSEYVSYVLDVLLGTLFTLSMDSRPEVQLLF